MLTEKIWIDNLMIQYSLVITKRIRVERNGWDRVYMNRKGGKVTKVGKQHPIY